MNNTLLHADAVVSLTALRKQAGCCVDLCYVDPPFNAGGAFGARTAPGTRRGRTARTSPTLAYEDSWGGLDGFLAFLEPALRAMRDVLTPRGMLWLHLDLRAVHDAKVLCDGIFGRGAFRGEVIWVPGNGARARSGPSTTHQTLLIYSRSTTPAAKLTWNDDHPLLREPYAETSRRMHFRNVDENGRCYRDRIVGGKRYRYYADDGRRLGSVWCDIPAMVANTPIRTEGTGYPTQKPEKLLERIIRLATRPDDVVCDPMCGSGTTLVVAGRLGRHFFGGDSSPLAIATSTQRLANAGLSFDTTLNEQPQSVSCV